MDLDLFCQLFCPLLSFLFANDDFVAFGILESDPAAQYSELVACFLAVLLLV